METPGFQTDHSAASIVLAAHGRRIADPIRGNSFVLFGSKHSQYANRTSCFSLCLFEFDLVNVRGQIHPITRKLSWPVNHTRQQNQLTFAYVSVEDDLFKRTGVASGFV